MTQNDPLTIISEDFITGLRKLTIIAPFIPRNNPLFLIFNHIIHNRILEFTGAARIELLVSLKNSLKNSQCNNNGEGS